MIALFECLILLVIGGGMVAGLVLVIASLTKKQTQVLPQRDGGLVVPPPKQERMKVVQIRSTAFVRVIENGVEHTEELPPNPTGAGCYPTQIAAGPGGEVFMVGKFYSGKPGPDNGVCYRRRGGQWEIFHLLEGKTFHSICIDGEKIYVGSVAGYTVFDGAGWTFHSLPTTAAIDLWLENGKLLGTTWGMKSTYDLSGPQPLEVPLRKAEQHDECEVGGVRFIKAHRQQELGEVTLSEEESKQMKGELDQLAEALSKQPRS